MSHVIVESYEGDRLIARLPDGTLTGRAIISLMGGLVLYCEDDSQLGEKEKSFFQSLAGNWHGDICVELCDLYYEYAYYNGKGLRTKSEDLSYTGIDNCIAQLEKLLQIFEKEQYQSNVWYESLESDQQFRAFLSVLNSLKDHKADTVRFLVMM